MSWINWLYLISCILYICLWLVYKNTTDGNYEPSPIKIKRWLILIAFIAFLIPVLNLVYAALNWVVYGSQYETYGWKIRKDNKLLNWLNESI